MRVILAILILALATARGADAGLQVTPLFTQNFEGAKPGPPPAPILDNSGWAGSDVPMTVVGSGDDRYGNLLECRVSGYCQIVLGQIAMVKGHLYQVSLDLGSAGAQNVTLILRRGGSPYTVYVSSNETTAEEMHRSSFIGRAVDDDGCVLLMLLMNGYTTLRLDNIRIEEVAGELPAGDPPVPGNRLFNAGFELFGDGWFLRGPTNFATPDPACEGRRALCLGRGGMASSTWLALSMQADYAVRARVRSLAGPASLRVGMNNYQFPRGGAGKAQSFPVPAGGTWQTVGFVWRPPAPVGKITRSAEYYFQVVCEGPDDAVLAVDACEVRTLPEGGAATEFAPRAPQEFALTTDAPYNVATVGELVRVTALATALPAAAGLVVCDEGGTPLRRLPLQFVEGRAVAALADLPCGYWQLVTAPLDGSTADPALRIEAETYLAVVPAMPELPLRQWICGTHIPDAPDLRQACWKLGLRWDRLHDTATWSKWPAVEPTAGEWTFADDALDRFQAQGQAILGLLDRVPKWAAGEPFTPAETKARIALRPETLPGWEEYVRQTAAHWKGRIDAWEVMNEPYGSVAPAEYLKVLIPAYRGVKAGNPGATVVGLGGPGPADHWLFETLKLGAASYCDAISVHGYGATIWSTVNGPDRLLAVVGRIRAALAEAGAPDLPIWDSECGPSVRSTSRKYLLLGGESEALEAARMFPKSVAAAKAAGLARVLYYSGHEKTHTGDGGAGLFLTDLNRCVRLGAVPLAVAASQLEGRCFVEQVRHLEQTAVVHLVFAGRGATVHLLWSNVGEQEVALPQGATEVLNMWGRPLAGATGALRLSPDPVYAIVPAR
jgi:hypothetical protein